MKSTKIDKHIKKALKKSKKPILEKRVSLLSEYKKSLVDLDESEIANLVTQIIEYKDKYTGNKN